MNTGQGESAPLATEFAAFLRDREHLLREHKGDFAIYKADKFHGAFSTFELAYGEGIRRFGLEPFLVKQVVDEEKPEKFPALMLGVLRANP